MSEVTVFGEMVLLVACGFALALASSRVTARVRVPAPAAFLLAAAVASDLVPALGDALSIRSVERIGVVALIAILFDGGMEIGARRFRASLLPILSLGVLGTLATAALVAVAAHVVFPVGWTTAWIMGAALAPTDPAVMFSVLGGREVRGRAGTILQGESGANDPVGIALMVGLLDYATGGGSVTGIGVEFVVEMGVGLAFGLAGGYLVVWLMRHVSLPGEGLYPLRTLASAGIVYGAASAAHGSGFLAVFVAGVLVGDVRAPYKGEIERFHAALASLGEIVVFVALGLTIELGAIELGTALRAVALALVLMVVARPLACGPLLALLRLDGGERAFVAWSGLKGAVPILLAAFALLVRVDQARLIYQVVFICVLVSVVVQGSTIETVARRLGVGMREHEQEPWDLALRLREEPRGVRRLVVAAGSRAEGREIRDLPIGEDAWISLIIRRGAPVRARGGEVLEAGDELLVLAEHESGPALARLFSEAR